MSSLIKSTICVVESICNPARCTGCGLCAAQCPKQCISMTVQDSLGHLYPSIDSNTCIDCGLCKRNCPVLRPPKREKAIMAYAGWSKDTEDYRTSSSGGAASVLSQTVLSQGGVVYGCAMLPDMEVRHIRVDKPEDIWKLKGSKYVQSSIAPIIPSLKKDVKAGRETLFIGTPCQVAAIRNLYENQPNNLFLIDLICHGVPSVALLREHVVRKVGTVPVETVFFRQGKVICLGIVVSGKVVYKRAFDSPRYKDWYINTFFDGYTFRDSCYQCQYACPERVSDMTIGDFWGLGKIVPAIEIPPHPDGCSVLLPNTEKGRDLVDRISAQMYLYERTLAEAISGNEQLRHPYPMDLRKKAFRKFYPHIGRLAYYGVIADRYLGAQGNRIRKKLKRILK